MSVVLIIRLFFAAIPARIAKNKGHNFAAFFLLGLLSLVVGLIVALCVPDKTERGSEAGRPLIVADELKKYNELLQQGAISEEEYDRLKTKLLNRVE